MRIAVLFLCACAGNAEHVVQPAQALLNDAKTMTADDACQMLTKALASGDYSTQRLQADNLSAMNDEYQIGHARETYCRQVERREGKLSDLEKESDVVTLKAIAISDGEDEGVRKAAARRLVQVLPDVADKDKVMKLTQMEVKSELPAWYLAMRVEEQIEQRYWELHADVPADLQRKVQALVTAQSQLARAAIDDKGVAEARAAYAKSEAEVCAAFAGLDPQTKQAAIAVVMDPILKDRIQTIAEKGCAR